MEPSLDTPAPAADSRLEALLEAAVGTFARYGYRKTSMDDVARAAGVSRQGLYLVFSDKEELFRRALAYKLGEQLSGAVAALSDDRVDLASRLVAASDAWAGQFVGILGADAADLMCASTTLAGGLTAEYQDRFEQALVRALERSPVTGSWGGLAVTPAEVAKALHATVRGLKQTCRSREEFRRGVEVAARLYCQGASPPQRSGSRR